MMQIPVKELKALAKKLNLSHVIVFAHDGDGQTDHIATYGRTIEQCSQAADFGNRMKKALGWPEHLQAQPPRVQRLQQELDELGAFLDSLGDIAMGDTALVRVKALVHHYINQIGRWAAIE